MNITEIEQLSFGQLKADRPALTEAAKKVPVDVLASHFIRALMDAKHRDEKLGEQGRTIRALQEGLAAVKAQAETERGTSTDLATQSEGLIRQLQAADHMGREISKARDELAARCSRLKVVAARHHDAVASAAKLLNNALAAQAIDTADTGE